MDLSFAIEFEWLFGKLEIEQTSAQIKESPSSQADPQLVKLFKSTNGPDTPVTDQEIIAYIQKVGLKIIRFESSNEFFSFKNN